MAREFRYFILSSQWITFKIILSPIFSSETEGVSI